MTTLHRLPADYLFKPEEFTSNPRDHYLALDRLPSLTSADLARFRPLARRHSSKVPQVVSRDLSRLKASLYNSLLRDPDLAFPLVDWAVDRKLIQVPTSLSGTEMELTEGRRKLLSLLSGNNSGWFMKVFYENLREHQDYHVDINELKARFQKRIRPLISGGVLPISEAQVQKKLAGVGVDVVNFFRSPEDSIGYDGERRKIIAQSLDLETYTISDFFHEFFHAISGTSIVLYTGENRREVSLQRIGVSITNLLDPETLHESRYEWLNEAITEKLTRMICPDSKAEMVDPEGGAYSSELALLDTLISKWGISQEVILAAYFQDYDHTKAPGCRYPAWRQLVNEFNFAFEPRFLQSLERFIWRQVDGVERALEILQGDDFTQISKYRPSS